MIVSEISAFIFTITFVGVKVGVAHFFGSNDRY